MKQPTSPQTKEHKRPLRRIAFLLLFFVVSVFGIQMGSTWYNDKYGPMGGYNLRGLNYRDLPITSFWVNDVWGGNVFAGSASGGGGTTCCLMISRQAKKLTVTWEVEQTNEEARANKPIELKSREVELPEITNQKRGHLAIHFLPNDEIKLTFQEFGATPLMPIKEINPGFSLFDDVKQEDFEKKRSEF